MFVWSNAARWPHKGPFPLPLPPRFRVSLPFPLINSEPTPRPVSRSLKDNYECRIILKTDFNKRGVSCGSKHSTKMPFVTALDQKVYYQLTEPESPHGITFFFIHGLGSSHAFYATIIPSLVERGHRCLAVDTPGASSCIPRSLVDSCC